jgi:hypothetical protein
MESNRQPVSGVSYLLEANEFAGKELVSFDVYADGDRLHAVFATKSGRRKQPFIAYIHSEDGGLNWSRPSAIGQYVKATVESALGNDIQVAAHDGKVLVVWQVTGEIPGMGPLQVLYSADGGRSWKTGVDPTGDEVDQSHPELIADADERFHLVWLDDRDENGYQGIRYARTDNGMRWDAAQTVDESTCSCCWNRLLSDGDDGLYVLYRDMEPRDMALAQSKDAGNNWHRVSTVGEFNWHFDGCPHNGGAMAFDSGGLLHALVWTGAENKAGLYYVQSADAGATWSQPSVMGGDRGLAFHSDIAAHDASHIAAVWDVRGVDGSSVMFSESFDAGAHWQSAKQISAPGASATFPRLQASRSGYLAMWLEQEPGKVKQWAYALLK